MFAFSVTNTCMCNNKKSNWVHIRTVPCVVSATFICLNPTHNYVGHAHSRAVSLTDSTGL